MFKAALASWRTTLTACILAVDAILHAVSALIDSDPMTNPDWNTVIMLLVAAGGLLFARDANVSSQESGIRP
jgi:hypothetical protein